MVSPNKAQQMPFGVAVLFTLIGGGMSALFLWWIAAAAWVNFAYRPATATVADRRLTAHSGKGGPRYQLEVLLQYHANDEDYSAWLELPRITHQDSGPEAEAVLNQLQVGQEVTCFHDLYKPAAVVLEKNRFIPMVCGLICPSLFLWVGLAGMATSWHKTFPRGVAVETADLLRRLPRRFYAAAAALLAVALAGGVLLWNFGSLLGCFVVVLFLGILAVCVGLGRLAVRYGAVAVASPEKRALPEPPAETPEAPGTLPPPASAWSQPEPVAVDAGDLLPVRLKPTLFSDAFVIGVLWGFCAAVAVTIILANLLTRWLLGEGSGAVTALFAVLGLLVIVPGTVIVVRRFARRQSRLQIELTEHPLPAGGSYRLAVRHPDGEELRRLALELVCEEGSSQGKNSTRAIAFRQAIPLDEPSVPGDVRHGRLDIPASAPSSLKTQHHEITWQLVTGRGRWLSWKLRCPLTVTPAQKADGPAPLLPTRPPRLEEGPVALWLDAEMPVFWPGDALTGGFTIRSAEQGPLRTAELSVLWYTAPPGEQEMGVAHYDEHTAVDGDDLPLYGTRQFQARLPDGPSSYDGKAVIIRWVVRLRLRYVTGDELLRELPFRLGRIGLPQATEAGSRTHQSSDRSRFGRRSR
jgi:hypothetical protein